MEDLKALVIVKLKYLLKLFQIVMNGFSCFEFVELLF